MPVAPSRRLCLLRWGWLVVGAVLGGLRQHSRPVGFSVMRKIGQKVDRRDRPSGGGSRGLLLRLGAGGAKAKRREQRSATACRGRRSGRDVDDSSSRWSRRDASAPSSRGGERDRSGGCGGERGRNGGCGGEWDRSGGCGVGPGGRNGPSGRNGRGGRNRRGGRNGPGGLDGRNGRGGWGGEQQDGGHLSPHGCPPSPPGDGGGVNGKSCRRDRAARWRWARRCWAPGRPRGMPQRRPARVSGTPIVGCG